MAIAHTTTADPNPDSRMPRASLPVSILLPAVARQQPLAVPLPQHAAATSALVYLPGEQAVPITSNFTRGMQSVAGPASRESASQDQQGAERSSPFCVGMLLNRFKYGDAVQSDVQDPPDCRGDRWCPTPPPPCSTWRQDAGRASGDKGVELQKLPSSCNRSANENSAEEEEKAEEDEDQECVVCMEKLHLGDDASSLTCRHVYHYDCIQSWFVQELNSNGVATCPVCKVTVFDARHLRPIAVENTRPGPTTPLPTTSRERTQIEV